MNAHRVAYLVFALAVAIIGAAAAGSGAGPVNDVTGTGLSGYDAVSYFEHDGPVQGLPKFSAVHDGVTYLFASAGHRDAFLADPQKYLPQFGGYCAIATANGLKVTIDPHAYAVIDNKLYLNHSMGAQASFDKDRAGNISKAIKNWPEVQKLDGPDH